MRHLLGAENLNGLLRRAIMKKKFEKHRIKPKKKKIRKEEHKNKKQMGKTKNKIG